MPIRELLNIILRKTSPLEQWSHSLFFRGSVCATSQMYVMEMVVWLFERGSITGQFKTSLYYFVGDFRNIDFNAVFSSLDFMLSKWKGFYYAGTGWREFSEIVICSLIFRIDKCCGDLWWLR